MAHTIVKEEVRAVEVPEENMKDTKIVPKEIENGMGILDVMDQETIELEMVVEEVVEEGLNPRRSPQPQLSNLMLLLQQERSLSLLSGPYQSKKLENLLVRTPGSLVLPKPVMNPSLR